MFRAARAAPLLALPLAAVAAWTRRPRCFESSRRLDISYQRKAVLGRGSYSAVYLGKDTTSNTPVALKIMSKKDFSQVTHDELSALIKIKEAGSHPNIVDLKGLVDIDGKNDEVGLVFELLEGGELYEHLVRNGAYSEHRAAQIVQQVAQALTWLHGIGLAHGDLKPENLVLNKDGTVVKLCDFGSTVHLDEDGCFSLYGHRPVGTVAYAAPELLRSVTRSSRASCKVDVWSLGVILYVMQSGLHPFDQDNEISTDEELAPLVIKGDFDFDAPIWSSISPECKQLIRKMIEPDPEKRISAKEILEDPWVVSGGSREALVGSDVRLKGFMRTQRVLQDFLFKKMVDGSLKSDKDALDAFWKSIDTEGKGFITAADLSESTTHISSLPSPGKAAAANGEGEDKVFYKSLNGLVGMGEKLSLGANVTVFEAGDEADSFYFVTQGKIEVIIGGRVVTTMGAGDFFGETALLRNNPRNATVRTSTPCELVRFSREDFDRLAQRDLGVHRALRERVAQRSVEHLKSVYSFLFHDAQTVHLGAGGVLLKKGEPSEAMYYIDTGVVDVVNSTGAVVAQRKEGETVGELGLVTGEPRSMTIRCAAPMGCAFKRLTREDLDRLVSFSPHADSELRSAIVGRLREAPARRSLTRMSQGNAASAGVGGEEQ